MGLHSCGRSRMAAWSGCSLALAVLLLANSRFVAAQSSIFNLCATKTGYLRVINLQMEGSEDAGVSYSTLAEAESACNDRADCYGFSALQNATEFKIKTAAIMPTTTVDRTCTYIKIRPFTSSCSTLSGYTSTADVAVGVGANIIDNQATLTAARTVCEATEGCAAIVKSSGGGFDLLDTATPMVYSRFGCVYTKLSTSTCKSTYRGFKVYPDYRVKDYYAVDVNENNAFKTAQSNALVNSFSSDGRYGTGFTKEYSRGFCYYEKTNITSCPSLPYYVSYVNQDWWGYPIDTKATVALAAEACYQDNDCDGFNSFGVTRARNIYGSLKYKFGVCYYAKAGAKPPPPPSNPMTGDVRLKPYLDSNPLEGRIEIYNDARMAWGTICNTGATDRDTNGNYWGDNLANVVCLTLGHASGTMMSGNNTGTPGPIAFVNVQCPATATDLSDCTNADSASWGTNVDSCTHEQDLGAKCIAA